MHLLNYFIVFIIFLGKFSFVNASVLEKVKERGYLKCGISEPLVGFADVDDNNEWFGFDVDICRSVATSIFGDPNKVEFTTTTNRSRFPMLASEEIDLLSRVTTWTFSRDVNLSFEFAGVNFYDGLAFMTKSSLNISSTKELDGASICIVPESSTAFYVNQFFFNNNINYNSVDVELDDEAYENFISGRCDVYVNFITSLANKRLMTSNSNQFVIHPELISKEPLGVVVRHGDSHWKDIVFWSLNVMIIAEELGLNSKNVDNFYVDDLENDEISRMLGLVGAYGDMIELEEEWAFNIIKYIGNYQEIYDKNLGSKSPLNIPRGLNNLYNNGGLLYSPPFK